MHVCCALRWTCGPPLRPSIHPNLADGCLVSSPPLPCSPLVSSVCSLYLSLMICEYINLLWPFVTQNHFESGMALLQESRAFQAIAPFKVKLEKFGFNENSKHPFYHVFGLIRREEEQKGGISNTGSDLT